MQPQIIKLTRTPRPGFKQAGVHSSPGRRQISTRLSIPNSTLHSSLYITFFQKSFTVLCLFNLHRPCQPFFDIVVANSDAFCLQHTCDILFQTSFGFPCYCRSFQSCFVQSSNCILRRQKQMNTFLCNLKSDENCKQSRRPRTSGYFKRHLLDQYFNFI